MTTIVGDTAEHELDKTLDGAAAGMGYCPPITISRSFGAGGARMGRIVADQLGFAFWDRELVQRIVDDTRMDRRVMDSVDEQMRGLLRGLMDGLSARTRHAETEYEHSLLRVLGALASKGGVVLVGRGGAFVLGDEPALRVRVVCPLVVRTRRQAARRNLQEAAARRLIQRKDTARELFVRGHFGEEIGAPDNYDVVINTHRLALGQAADIVAHAYRMRFGDPAVMRAA